MVGVTNIEPRFALKGETYVSPMRPLLQKARKRSRSSSRSFLVLVQLHLLYKNKKYGGRNEHRTVLRAQG
jgi:hypothetical protein